MTDIQLLYVPFSSFCNCNLGCNLGGVKFDTSCCLSCDVCLYWFPVPPTVTEAPQSKTINEGDRLQLTCKASGQPTPTITWTKDGNQLGKTVDIQNSKRTDAGTYVCKAENKVTQVTASAQVTVQCKSERSLPVWL